MKVWLTKHALTTGIIMTAEAKLCGGKMIQVGPDRMGLYYHKPFWHEDEKSAVAHIQVLRERKIASLRKALSRLEDEHKANNHTFKPYPIGGA